MSQANKKMIVFRAFVASLLLLGGGQAWAADTDGDGVDNSVDAFPNDACATVDTDTDGKPDVLLTCGPVVLSNQSFETGVFTYNWTTGGNSNWFIQNTTAHTGTRSARSGALTQGQTSWLETYLSSSDATQIVFYTSQNAVNLFGSSRLNFYIDGVLKGNLLGLSGWSKRQYAITSGTHVYSWEFIRGSDTTSTVWIDDVQTTKPSSLIADVDDDNDGVLDVNDKFPLDAARWQQVRHSRDIDNDSDVLVRSASAGDWTSYAIQSGAITGNAALNIPTDSDTQYIAQLDANGDGDADMLTRSVSTGAWTLHQVQSGAVTLSTPFYLYASLDWQFVGTGDLNGNGTDDVLLRSTSTGLYNSFLINNYAVSSVNAFNAWSSAASVDQGIGDFDGDGSDDLLIRRTTENAYFVFRSINGLVENYYCACNLWYNPDWTFQFAGDTNKDGIDDIAVRGTGASGDGLWWAFRMNNFVSTQTTNLNLFTNKTAVTLGAVGDYNGDGTVDVLTRVNGETTYVSPINNGLVTGNNWLQNFTTDQGIQK